MNLVPKKVYNQRGRFNDDVYRTLFRYLLIIN